MSSFSNFTHPHPLSHLHVQVHPHAAKYEKLIKTFLEYMKHLNMSFSRVFLCGGKCKQKQLCV